jgi:uncharacterized membrane protein YoaK (UPF0700 family)
LSVAQSNNTERRDQVRTARHRRSKSAIALVLTFIAGFVDIAGLFTIYDVFTAHMSGNTVRLGEHLLQRNWTGALITAAVLGAFVFGSIVGRIIIEIGARASIRSIASASLAIEAVLFITVVVLGAHTPRKLGDIKDSLPAVILLLALLAIGMGLQTATVTRIGALTVHTTFVTGMLNKLAQLISHWLFHSYDLRCVDASQLAAIRAHRRHVAQQTLFMFAIWFCYLAGAFCGTWATYSWGLKALFVASCLLLATIVVDQLRPLSLEEERDRPER